MVAASTCRNRRTPSTVIGSTSRVSQAACGNGDRGGDMNSWALTPLHGVIFVLQLIALVVKLFALIDCIAVPEGAFVATGKQTKPIWLAILGVAVLASFIGFLSILGL